jgi:hypothetical protein
VVDLLESLDRLWRDSFCFASQTNAQNIQTIFFIFFFFFFIFKKKKKKIIYIFKNLILICVLLLLLPSFSFLSFSRSHPSHLNLHPTTTTSQKTQNKTDYLLLVAVIPLPLLLSIPPLPSFHSPRINTLWVIGAFIIWIRRRRWKLLSLQRFLFRCLCRCWLYKKKEYMKWSRTKTCCNKILLRSLLDFIFWSCADGTRFTMTDCARRAGIWLFPNSPPLPLGIATDWARCKLKLIQ